MAWCFDFVWLPRSAEEAERMRRIKGFRIPPVNPAKRAPGWRKKKRRK